MTKNVEKSIKYTCAHHFAMVKYAKKGKKGRFRIRSYSAIRHLLTLFSSNVAIAAVSLTGLHLAKAERKMLLI